MVSVRGHVCFDTSVHEPAVKVELCTVREAATCRAAANDLGYSQSSAALL